MVSKNTSNYVTKHLDKVFNNYGARKVNIKFSKIGEGSWVEKNKDNSYTIAIENANNLPTTDVLLILLHELGHIYTETNNQTKCTSEVNANLWVIKCITEVYGNQVALKNNFMKYIFMCLHNTIDQPHSDAAYELLMSLGATLTKVSNKRFKIILPKVYSNWYKK